MTAVQVIPKNKKALSLLKLMEEMGIIQLGIKEPKRGSLAEVVADVKEDVEAPLTMDEIVAIIKQGRSKRNGKKGTPARR